MTLSFEDVANGWLDMYGIHWVERRTIVAFAKQFDSLHMHIDS